MTKLNIIVWQCDGIECNKTSNQFIEPSNEYYKNIPQIKNWLRAKICDSNGNIRYELHFCGGMCSGRWEARHGSSYHMLDGLTPDKNYDLEFYYYDNSE